MATMPLMQQAAQKAAPAQGESSGGFKEPDITSMIPPELRDIVERVHAAGLKIMTAPEMRDEVQQGIQSPDPVPQKLAQNVTGLLLTLDKKSAESQGGGIPPAALFPAGMLLLGEAAHVLEAAGQPVSQDDFNTGAMMLYGMIGEQLGLSQDELMQGAAQSLGGQDNEQEPVEEPPTADDEQPGTETAPPPGGMPGEEVQ